MKVYFENLSTRPRHVVRLTVGTLTYLGQGEKSEHGKRTATPPRQACCAAASEPASQCQEGGRTHRACIAAVHTGS